MEAKLRTFASAAEMRAARKALTEKFFPSKPPRFVVGRMPAVIEVRVEEAAKLVSAVGQPVQAPPPKKSLLPVPPPDRLPDPSGFEPKGDRTFRLTLEEIVYVVSEFYGVARADFYSRRRAGPVAFARHVVVSLAYDTTMLSMPSIGKKLGGRDHTTVLNSLKRISDRRENDPQFDHTYRQLGAFCQELARHIAEFHKQKAQQHEQPGPVHDHALTVDASISG
jgi:hypothetical protein